MNKTGFSLHIVVSLDSRLCIKIRNLVRSNRMMFDSCARASKCHDALCQNAMQNQLQISRPDQFSSEEFISYIYSAIHLYIHNLCHLKKKK